MPAHSGAIEVVIFDLGGVLIGWDPAALFAPLLPPGQDVELFLEETDFYAWNLEHDRGSSWELAAASVRSTHPQHAETFRRYPELFDRALTGEVPGTRQVLSELQQRDIRVLALTNFARANLDTALRKHPWLAGFEAMVVSGDERAVKPDPEIFRILMRRHAVQPKSAVFIDDRSENVQAARELGFHGIDFVDAGDLREQLVGLGVLPADLSPG